MILDNLKDLRVLDVYFKGVRIVRDETVEIKPCDPQLKNTVHILDFKRAAFASPPGKTGLCHQNGGRADYDQAGNGGGSL